MLPPPPRSTLFPYTTLFRSDVSGNGCYVETILPLPVGTTLRVDFYLENQHIKISAVVRTCDPGVGNGIEFTGDRKSTRLNSSHQIISYAVFCLKKKNIN